jgi:hypothetical protein
MKKFEEIPSELHKSPLTPLFQRGELGLERAALSSTFGEQLYVTSSTFPPLKKGDERGIFGLLCALCAVARENF